MPTHGDGVGCGTLQRISERVGDHSTCAPGDAAAWPIEGLVKHFRPRLARRIVGCGGGLSRMTEAAA